MKASAWCLEGFDDLSQSHPVTTLLPFALEAPLLVLAAGTGVRVIAREPQIANSVAKILAMVTQTSGTAGASEEKDGIV
jgi:hypothetical protein|eukprot:CAMPEP_0197121058 /NCGR_PEP_ID=MMETSP1390-20130617/3292_1 /TAXON_ID=38833 /ORGANISM="Micromonas sp., Strain CCMP2099" /LENGTH=78 /DNA_ID=CAMNT_0042562919 /DNA_START=781 /DNA_END=1017 /DNA_ORIENTATION=-